MLSNNQQEENCELENAKILYKNGYILGPEKCSC